MDNATANLGQPLTIFDNVYDFNGDGRKDSVVIFYDPSNYPELKAYVALQPKRKRDKETIVPAADLGFTHTAQAYTGVIPTDQPIPTEADLVRVVLKGDVARLNAENVYDSIVLERLYPQDGGPDWILKTTIDGTPINHGPNKRETERSLCN